MKKNVMMRLASFLLVAVLISTSAISGTYAKYVTEGSANDSARVAKWGVTLEMDGDSNFMNEYKTHDAKYSGKVSVKSSDDAKVVAPGTSSADVDGGLTFKITGTPEVATKVDISMTVNNDIVLTAGEYDDATTAVAGDKFTLSDNYYPVVYTLTQTADGQGAENKVIASGNLNAIKTALETYAQTAYYAPNTKLDATFQLTWAWAFNGAQTLNGVDFDADIVDKADTYLGNQAAVNSGNTKINYELTITVTQVD